MQHQYLKRKWTQRALQSSEQLIRLCEIIGPTLIQTLRLSAQLVCGRMLTRPYYIATYTAQPHFVFLRNTSRIRADDPRAHKNVGLQNNSSDPTADWQASHEFRTAPFSGPKATVTKVVSSKGRSPTKCHTSESSSVSL